MYVGVRLVEGERGASFGGSVRSLPTAFSGRFLILSHHVMGKTYPIRQEGGRGVPREPEKKIWRVCAKFASRHPLALVTVVGPVQRRQ